VHPVLTEGRDPWRRAGASMVLLAGLAGLVAVAAGQSIKMPDLRKPMTYQLQPGERCELCGRILSIREKHIQRRPAVPSALSSSQPGASPGGLGHANLVGAVVYLPLGNTDERPFVGGVGTPEMRERFRQTTYEITVRLDEGSLRFLERYDGTRYRVGDKVRLPGAGQIELLAE
jgi:outer membrane lipoprotein SlyB